MNLYAKEDMIQEFSFESYNRTNMIKPIKTELPRIIVLSRRRIMVSVGWNNLSIAKL